MRAKHHRSHTRGVRAVASIEILKGALAVIATVAVATVLHRDLGDFAEDIIFKLHVNPSGRVAWFIIDKAYDISGRGMWLIVAVGSVYAIVRFIEGYGLWRERVWAEWFALVSGAAYLPFEVYEVIRRPNGLHWGVLATNIAVVLYMAYVRFYDPDPPQPQSAP